MSPSDDNFIQGPDFLKVNGLEFLWVLTSLQKKVSNRTFRSLTLEKRDVKNNQQ